MEASLSIHDKPFGQSSPFSSSLQLFLMYLLITSCRNGCICVVVPTKLRLSIWTVQTNDELLIESAENRRPEKERESDVIDS